MKERLIILSDLWGKEKAGWLPFYTKLLSQQFDVVFYDCCELGDIDKSIYVEEALHKQFVNGGIRRAVEQLITLEQAEVTVLAFSVGGTIGWKFALETGLTKALYCVSATRLRHERHKPSGNISLYFGEHEEFGPKADWFETMNLQRQVIKHQGHLLYKNVEVAGDIARAICSRSAI